MKLYNVFTGEEIPEENNQPIVKQMCLNCISCMHDDEFYHCNNKNVMESGVKKVYESLPEGFEIESLVLKPMLLKNPTKKCSNYCVDKEFIVNELMSYLQ